MAQLLTAQQQRAVTTRGVSVVLSSGAGCGKTHVLTERYLAHLREGARVEDIVAITFTDRAARQMRARIRAALEQHHSAATSDADAEQWSGHLRDLEQAPISTIHSFAGALLRQHAIVAGLDPRFEVLEEVLAGNLRDEALAEALQGLLTCSTPVADDLRALVVLLGWRAVQETVASLIRDHDLPCWQAWLETPAEQSARALLAHAEEAVWPRHLDFRLASQPAIRRCLALLRQHPPLPGPMSDPVALLLRETPLLARAPDRTAAIERLFEAAKVGRVGSKAWPDPEVYQAIKQAFEAFRSALKKLDEQTLSAEIEDVLPGIEAGKKLLRVSAEVIKAYEDRKRRHGVLDFHDLLVAARDLLRQDADVRALVQGRYQHLLLDELQDTDRVQMELVELLAGPGLTTGKVFSVGDHKQSIYRFRGADVSLFQALGARVGSAGQQTLSVSFRSQPAILAFVNALFAPAIPEYEPLLAHLPQSIPGPCVEFLWTPRDPEASASEARAAEADTLARRIVALVAEGRFRRGDIVLLFRAMSNVHLYEAALRRHGLDYYLVGGRAFFAQQEIHDIVNLLRAIENPQDNVSLAGVLRSPFCSLSDEALFVLGRHRRGLWSALFDEHTERLLPAGQLDRVLRSRRLLAGWRLRKDRLGVAPLLLSILDESGYDAAVRLEFLGERKLANLWKLIDLARKFDRSGLFGMAEFIGRLGELVASQPREEQAATLPESADVVRLMTIHQAKGLEFPVVIVPDLAAASGMAWQPQAVWHPRLGCVVRPPADEDPPPFSRFAWLVREASETVEDWHEDVRTLYVACTRPRDTLILSASLTPGEVPTGPWMQTLAATFDLTSGAGPVPVRLVDPATLPVGEVRAALSEAVSAPPSVPTLNLQRGAALVWCEELEEELARSASLFAPPTPVETAVSRSLRDILDMWDFRDPQGWLELLPERLADEDREQLYRLLEAFARSSLRQRLAEARAVRRRVEFLVQLEPQVPGVAGHLDCLWQDDEERWNLLEWVREPVSGHEAHWESREPVLGLAARAFQQQTGAWPRNVGLYFLFEERLLQKPGHRLPWSKIGKQATNVLERLASRPVGVR